MSLSHWCEQGTIEIWKSPLSNKDLKWRYEKVSGHAWCTSQRWHDEYHGKDPGCCASLDERESWACECPCHEEENACNTKKDG